MVRTMGLTLVDVKYWERGSGAFGRVLCAASCSRKPPCASSQTMRRVFVGAWVAAWAMAWVAGMEARAAGSGSSCAATIRRAYLRYALKRFSAISHCERDKLGGALADTVNCRPALGAVSDARTAERLARAELTLRSLLEGRCLPPLPAVGTACDGATTASELADCLTSPGQEPDANAATVDNLIETVFGAGGPVAKKSRRACVEAASRGVRAYLRRRTVALSRCEQRRRSGSTSDPCPDGRAIEEWASARPKLALVLNRHCRLEDLSGQDALVFGRPCEQYPFTIYRRSSGDGISNTIGVKERLIRCLSSAAASVAERVESMPLAATEAGPFAQGVAAGDATDSSAVFWTRLPDPGTGGWLELSTDPDFTAIVQKLPVASPAGTDGTVKIEVGGLAAATTYFYRFEQGGERSRVGRIRTAPGPTDEAVVRFGWSGDANAFFRPFGILEFLRHQDLDGWFFIGDTIYGDDTRADGVEAVSLEDYFAKHRVNRADSSLRNLMAVTGTYAQWDDHEVLNDFSGAVPAFADRMAAGNLAFRRYFPVREDQGDPARLYRSFRWGAAVEFFLIDPRQYRSAKIVCCNPPDPPVKVIESEVPLFGECPLGGQVLLPDETCKTALADPGRTFLGSAQKEWLESALLGSTAAFKFVMNGPPITEIHLQPYDRWEGYPAERAEILDFIEANGIENVIWLSADLHAMVISRERVDSGPSHFVPEIVAGPIGVESIFRQIVTIAPDALPFVPLLPALIPQVTEFDIDRFDVVVMTIDGTVVPPVARFDFVDQTGTVTTSLSFTATGGS